MAVATWEEYGGGGVNSIRVISHRHRFETNLVRGISWWAIARCGFIAGVFRPFGSGIQVYEASCRSESAVAFRALCVLRANRMARRKLAADAIGLAASISHERRIQARLYMGVSSC